MTRLCSKQLQIAATAALFATGAVAYSQSDILKVAEKAAAADPMLAAMQSELEREQQLLLLPGMQRPYFIEYRLDDFASFEAVANYGALTRESTGTSGLCG